MPYCRRFPYGSGAWLRCENDNQCFPNAEKSAVLWQLNSAGHTDGFEQGMGHSCVPPSVRVVPGLSVWCTTAVKYECGSCWATLSHGRVNCERLRLTLDRRPSLAGLCTNVMIMVVWAGAFGSKGHISCLGLLSLLVRRGEVYGRVRPVRRAHGQPQATRRHKHPPAPSHTSVRAFHSMVPTRSCIGQ